MNGPVWQWLEAAWSPLAGFVQLGGPVVAALLALSAFALAVVLVKAWQLMRLGGASQRQLGAGLRLWRQGEHEGALDAVEALRGPVAHVVAHAMRGLMARRAAAHVREETESVALRQLAGLRSYLRALEAVVQVAPLLGLFGTVLGMIEAFRAVEASGARVDPADLAGGIWVALLTTAVGLAIAMPTALALHWFEGRIEQQRQAMEAGATAVLTYPPELPPMAEARRRDQPAALPAGA